MKKVKQILLVHSGWFHPTFLARWYFKRILKETPGYCLTTVDSLESAAQLEFENFQAVVVYLHKEKVSLKVLNKFSSYISKGGGLVGVHSATASFKEEDLWFQIMGGRFSGHGPIEAIHYQKSKASEPSFRDESDFWVVDELYRHDLQPGVQPIYEADYEGEKQPMVWIYKYGEGRVFYACPGHKAAVFRNPVYRSVLKKGLDWVCSR